MKKLFLAICMAFALSGCANFKAFETRVTCSVAKDEARADSKWGVFGISSKVAPADAKVICNP